jgi:hypothetical protein
MRIHPIYEALSNLTYIIIHHFRLKVKLFFPDCVKDEMHQRQD